MKKMLFLALALIMTQSVFAQTASGTKTYGLSDPTKTGVTFQIGYSAGVHDGTVASMNSVVTLSDKNKILSGEFNVPLTAMSTGNKTRDCHMREALGIDYSRSQFPKDHVCDSNDQTPASGPDAIVYDSIKFKFSNVKDNSNSELPDVLEVGKVYSLAVQGQWTVHGIVQDFSTPMATEFIPVQVKLLDATTGELQLTGKFQISLKDFGVVVKPFKFGFISIGVADNAKITLNSKLSLK